MSLRRSARAGWLALACVWVWGCGGGKPAEATPGAVDPNKWPADDKSLCRSASPAETGGVKMSEMSLDTDEIAGVGSLRPNIRRVYRTIGEGEAKRRIVMCREVDTNLDGIKDVARFYDAKGAPISEKADRNFDGVLDVWVIFLDGKIAEIDEDTTKKTGRPNEWRLYNDGVLVRVRRDRNGDGKPDLWESYNNGKLERVGVDESGDGKVDRWDRDDVLRLEQEHAEQAALPDGGAGPATPFPETSPETSEPVESAGAKKSGKK